MFLNEKLRRGTVETEAEMVFNRRSLPREEGSPDTKFSCSAARLQSGGFYFTLGRRFEVPLDSDFLFLPLSVAFTECLVVMCCISH